MIQNRRVLEYTRWQRSQDGYCYAPNLQNITIYRREHIVCFPGRILGLCWTRWNSLNFNKCGRPSWLRVLGIFFIIFFSFVSNGDFYWEVKPKTSQRGTLPTNGWRGQIPHPTRHVQEGGAVTGKKETRILSKRPKLLVAPTSKPKSPQNALASASGTA